MVLQRKKREKKKTKEILKGFMMHSELKNHTAKIVLYKKSDSHFTIAFYISNLLITMRKVHYILVQKLMLKKSMNTIHPYGWHHESILIMRLSMFHCHFTVLFRRIILMYVLYKCQHKNVQYCKKYDIKSDLLESFYEEEFEDIAD